MNPQILNRESIAPRSSTWQQIEVSGEHPAMLGDERVVQVIDGEALRAMAAERAADMRTPDGELLVDKDHLSHRHDHDTEAYAWLGDVEVRDGQLWGNLEWTDLGSSAVRNKRLRYFSTEYDAEDLEDLGAGPDGVRRVRPRRLAGLALTNRPNNKGGRAITNRKAEEAEHNPNPTTNMKKVTDALGLAESATEDEIAAALQALIEKAEKADKIELEVEADKVLNRYAAKIPDGSRDEWRAGLIANREATEAILAKLPDMAPARPAAPPAITNRAKAKAPDGGPGGTARTEDDAARAAKIRNRANSIAKEQGLNFREAWALAEAEYRN